MESTVFEIQAYLVLLGGFTKFYTRMFSLPVSTTLRNADFTNYSPTRITCFNLSYSNHYTSRVAYRCDKTSGLPSCFAIAGSFLWAMPSGHHLAAC
jgi:hypothetical protein